MAKVQIPASAKSWVDVAPDSGFPIQNLPFGAGFGETEDGDVNVAPLSRIGDYAIHLWVLGEAGLLPSVEPGDPTPWGNGVDACRALRRELFSLFEAGNPILRDDADLRAEVLIPIHDLELSLPMPVTSFVDFYSGIHHASNVGKMFRPDQPPLLPNYRHLPIGYNGRASTCVATETPIQRPSGITKVGDDVMFGPCKELDFELEMGFYLAEGTQLGQRLSMGECEDFIAGLVLVNDWSARDIQRFEYQPLGPFLAKSFGTSVSPWIVSLDALEPFRVAGQTQDPAVLDHFRGSGTDHFDITLEVWLKSAKMTRPQKICTSNMKNLYWSIFQQLVHQSSNGTMLEAGDLYASGTISGESEDSFGSMLELSWRGQRPLALTETGETRTFLEDGDTVTMTAYAQADGYRIGFGEVSGTVAG